jgi:hypothetical protein
MRRLLALFLAVLLAACGGSGGDAQPPGPGEALPELRGRVDDGISETDVRSLQITVKGRSGRARTAEGRVAPFESGDYLASLDRLEAPYLLTDSAGASSGGLFSVAAGPGIANLTPLTTLLVAELLGAEPRAFFDALGTSGGFTQADAASIAAAEARVRRYLQREHGVELPATLGSFVTTPFTRVAGDPMHDTLRALVARIGSAGDYSAVVSAIAQESARCRIEQVEVTAGSVVDRFCPFDKRNEVDAADATVTVLGFGNRRGDRLTLRLRGAQVVHVERVTAEGAASRCSGSACAGIRIGTPDGRGVRAIVFDGARLSGSGGALRLDGTLASARPGVVLPGLPCTSNAYYLIDEEAGSAAGYCAAPDAFGLGAAGAHSPSGATRRLYTFDDGADGPRLEVVVEGTRVLRALVYRLDPATGAVTPQFQCRDGDCPGVSLGASRIDESLGVPVVLQPIRFDRARLAAVGADGSLSSTEFRLVEATLTGYRVEDPSALPLSPVACDAAAPTVLALPSDQAQPVRICEPADTQGFTLRFRAVDADGNRQLGIAALMSDGNGSFSTGHSITVTLAPAGALVSVVYDAFDGPRYRCLGSGCSGFTVSAPGAGGEQTVGFAGTQLGELGTGGLPADRSTTLQGSFIAPP